MRIVITGGAGFLGSHLCDYLLNKNDEIICIDNLITGRTENIAHLYGNPKFKFINNDVTEYIFIDGKVDFVIQYEQHISNIPQEESKQW